MIDALREIARQNPHLSDALIEAAAEIEWLRADVVSLLNGETVDYGDLSAAGQVAIIVDNKERMERAKSQAKK